MRNILAAILTICLFGSLSPAKGQAPVSFDDVENRIQACHSVIKNVLSIPENSIPRDLLQRSRGLAIFPRVLKVGVFVGVSFGNGLILRRDETTGLWSKPAFFAIKTGSLGPQLGAQYVDLILLVMNERGVQGLLEESYTLGADVSVAAGPVGREASAETNWRLDSAILSYSQTKGFFAGMSLTGTSVQPDHLANEAYHGKGVTGTRRIV